MTARTPGTGLPDFGLVFHVADLIAHERNLDSERGVTGVLEGLTSRSFPVRGRLVEYLVARGVFERAVTPDGSLVLIGDRPVFFANAHGFEGPQETPTPKARLAAAKETTGNAELDHLIAEVRRTRADYWDHREAVQKASEALDEADARRRDAQILLDAWVRNATEVES